MNEVIDFYKDTEIFGVNVSSKKNEAMILKSKSADISKSICYFGCRYIGYDNFG